MACATLKRSLDWESLNQRPTKRRRCNPFTTNSGSVQSSNAQVSSAKVTEPTQSVFADASLTKLTPGITLNSVYTFTLCMQQIHSSNVVMFSPIEKKI